ncbi:MAG: hypothetical protein MMC23_007283 [Stictis urceolatum]|nr:hypothetical protein [Stictis urceolata]
MLYNSSLFRWLQRKRYQYEVTVPLYMMTPTEKFIFSTPYPVAHWFTPFTLFPSQAPIKPETNASDSFLFLVLSLIIIAAALYLPEHISTIARRAAFYWAGEDAHAQLKDALVSEKVTQLTARTATAVREVVAQAATPVLERLADEL